MKIRATYTVTDEYEIDNWEIGDKSKFLAGEKAAIEDDPTLLNDPKIKVEVVEIKTMRLRATYTVSAEYEVDDSYNNQKPSDIITQEYSQISSEPEILEGIPGVIRDVEVVEVKE